MASASALESNRMVSPSPTQPLVAISILNWNGWQDTLECLESVRRLDYPNYLPVVVDNGSSNGSAEKIEAWAQEHLGPGHALAEYRRATALQGGEAQREAALEQTPSVGRLVLIRNEENLGFAGGNNVSIQYALGRRLPADYVLLLNNDALVARDVLTTLVVVAETTGAGTTGALVEGLDGKLKYPGFVSATRWLFTRHVAPLVPYPPTAGEFWESPGAAGAAMLISASALKDVHSRRGEYLKAALFMYYEEFDFHFHCHALGYKTVSAKRARVVHKGSENALDNRPRIAYYLDRNSIGLAHLVLSPPLRLLFHLQSLILLPARLLWHICRGRIDHARAILLGLVDGYRGRAGKWKYHDRPSRAVSGQ
jgi:hypothetical protein